MQAFCPATILLPKKGEDLQKWAVLACDQFTSQPEYWQQAEAFVGDAPSTLRLILPEVYLEGPGVEERTQNIHAAMQKALETTLTPQAEGFVYVERTLESGAVRQGIVGCVDLEAYSYRPGVQCAIRPSENTVVERIPPRLAVRRDAGLESPHILMLIDDAQNTVIEPVATWAASKEPLYDVDLMLGGGRLRGWALPEAQWAAPLNAAIEALCTPAAFAARYGLAEGDVTPFSMAVGDGNHSLASAKALWEEVKPTLSPEAQKTHPARYCLVELENVQSPAIEIESIHRVINRIEYTELKTLFERYAAQQGLAVRKEGGEGQAFMVVHAHGKTHFNVEHPPHPLPAGSFEAFYAWLEGERPGLEVDYIHGIDTVEELARAGGIGVILPDFEKDDLFRGVALGGVLPKKTFSMGHAREKRYYMECRKIR